MRTLSEITSAVRLAEPVTDEELRYAVVAYDVLMAALQLDQDAPRLQAYMVAAMADPKVYTGPGNDFATEEGLAWYRAFITAGQPVLCANCDCALPEGCGGIFSYRNECERTDHCLPPPTLTDTVCSTCHQPFSPVANQPPVVTCPGCSEGRY